MLNYEITTARPKDLPLLACIELAAARLHFASVADNYPHRY